MLKKLHEDLKAQNQPFEVVFVSSDRTEAEGTNYFKASHGDYFMLDYNDSVRMEIGQELGVRGIPALIIVDKDGKEKVGSQQMRQLVVEHAQNKDISAKLKEYSSMAGDWSMMGGSKLGSNAESSSSQPKTKEEIRKARLAALQKRGIATSTSKEKAVEKKLSSEQQKLKEMGYSLKQINEALKVAAGDFDTALAILMSQE